MRSRWLAAGMLVLFTIAILAATAALAFAAAPANNDFVNAEAITGTSGTRASSNTEATVQSGEVIPAGNTASIWYKYTADTTDTISFDTVGSVDPIPDPDEPIATEVHVYTGASVSTLVELPSSYLLSDKLPNGHVEFPLVRTQVYYIAITSPSQAIKGNTVLNWQTKGYTGHITGNVTATNGGVGVAGMQVDAYRVGGAGNSLRTATTVSGGNYDLQGLGTDNYYVSFTDPAPTTYLPEWWDNKPAQSSANPIEVVNGATTSGKNAALDRASTISGNVKSNGVNTAGVTVQLLPYTGDVLDAGGAVPALTDASGNFSFTGLYPKVGAGNYYRIQFVEPFGSGFTTQFYNLQSNIALATKLQPVEGTVLSGINCSWPTPAQPPGTLSGTVSSSIGGTLDVVTVTVSSGAGTANTAGGGLYSIGSIPPGTYSVKYSKVGYNDQWANVTITSNATTTQDVTLVRAPGTLSGTVSSSLGGTLDGVTVSVPGTPTVNTAANGTYSRTGLTPGPYAVTYSKVGFNSQTINVTINTGATTTQNVTLVRTPGTLSGTVNSSLGGPLEGVTVSVPGTPTVNTAANGTYSRAGLTPGTYSVTYSKANYYSQTINNVVLTSGATTTQDVTLVAIPGTLSGTVASGGSPVQDVTVSVPGTGTVVTAANGTYSVAGIAPGTYTVSYTKAGYNSQWISGVSITTGAITNENVTLIQTPGTLSGTVSDSNGTLDGVQVSVPGTGTVTTAGGGAYTLAGITPNTYSVTFTKAGYTPRTVDNVPITAGGMTDQDVVLVAVPPDTQPGVLSGTVTSGGNPIQGVEVSVPGTATVITDVNGGYSVAGVAPGTYSVTYIKTGYNTHTANNLVIPQGGTLDNDVVMTQTPGTLSGTVTISGGGALQGVTVTVSGAGSTTTAVNGTYAVPNVAPGAHTLTYAKPGYTTQTFSGYVINSGDNPKNVALVVVTSVPKAVWRFFKPSTGTHFYTADQAEKVRVETTMSDQYQLDGVGYTINTAAAANNAPLYRFFNRKTGTHFYTADLTEKARVETTMSDTYQLDGEAYKVSRTSVPGAKVVYRFYKPSTGTHFYTADLAEKARVETTMSGQYQLDGPGFYLAP